MTIGIREKHITACCMIVLCACSTNADDALQLRIQHVENGMLPAVSVAGEQPTPSTIWDVMESFSVPGVSVAVINEGVLEWAKGYGVLAAGGHEVNTETLFLAGQMSQAAATVGALVLVADGSLDLDANVNDRLRSWRVPDNEFTSSEKVTLRRLLTHTSGLTVRSLLGYAPNEPIPNKLQILDGVDPAKNEAVRVTAEPGAGQQYSVGAYVVLQQLMEDVTGLPYSQLVDSVVLSPLAMTRSTHMQPLSEELAANAACGHDESNARLEGCSRVYPELAAAGMWTTPSDLARLLLELQRAFAGESERLVSQTLAAEMLSQQFENRGLGVEYLGEGDWKYFRLEGHGNSYLSDFVAYVSQGKGAVVMTNSSGGEAVKAYILRSIAVEYGWPDLLPEELDAVSLPDETLEALVGTYSFRGRDRVLRLERGRLLQHSEGSPDQELRALSDSMLVSLTFGYRYGIDRDEAGSVTGLTLIIDGTRLFTYAKN